MRINQLDVTIEIVFQQEGNKKWFSSTEFYG